MRRRLLLVPVAGVLAAAVVGTAHAGPSSADHPPDIDSLVGGTVPDPGAPAEAPGRLSQGFTVRSPAGALTLTAVAAADPTLRLSGKGRAVIASVIWGWG